MLVNNLMSKKLFVGNVTDNLLDISKQMMEHDIGFMPIEEEGKIIGVITDRDIVIRLLANNEEKNSQIKTYVTNNIIKIESDSNVEDALKMMGDYKIKRLLVSENNKLVGILSLSDIINSDVDKGLIIETLKNIFQIKDKIGEINVSVREFIL